MGYVIWGTGNRGTNIYRYFQNDVRAFIESNPSKIGGNYLGKPVIGFKDYCKIYENDILIVSPKDDNAIIEILFKNKVLHFLRSNECPWEFVEMYEPDILNNISKYVKAYKNRKIYLIGLSIYGILVARILRALDCDYSFISEKKYTDDFYKIIDEQEKMHIEYINYTYNEDGAIFLVASGDKNPYITEKIITGRWEDIFFLGRFLPPKYINKDICQFKDRHKNESCFIVATGPSVKMEDLNLLHQNKKICISMNKIFYVFDQTDWRPDYYVGEDVNLFRYYSSEIKETVNAIKFLADTYECDADIYDNSFRYHVSFSDRNRRICGGEEFSQGYMCGYSVIVACLYLAMYMGFSAIYLIGADMNYSNTFSDPNNHFYGDKDMKGRNSNKVYSPFYMDTVIENCEYILKLANKKGIDIYNATRGGRLEVFERVDFESLF